MCNAYYGEWLGGMVSFEVDCVLYLDAQNIQALRRKAKCLEDGKL